MGSSDGTCKGLRVGWMLGMHVGLSVGMREIVGMIVMVGWMVGD